MAKYATHERLHAGAIRLRPPPLPRRPSKREGPAQAPESRRRIPDLTARLLRLEELVASLRQEKESRARQESIPVLDTGYDLVAPTRARRQPSGAVRWSVLSGGLLLTAALGVGAGLWGPSWMGEGAAAVAPEVTQAPPAVPVPTHRVKRGETLGIIAEERLGDAARWKEIVELNRDVLPNPDELEVGFVLRLPAS